MEARKLFNLDKKQAQEIRQYLGECFMQTNNVTGMAKLLNLGELGSVAYLGFLFGRFIEHNERRI